MKAVKGGKADQKGVRFSLNRTALRVMEKTKNENWILVVADPAKCTHGRIS